MSALVAATEPAATPAGTPAATPRAMARPGLPFTRLIRVEVRKVVNTRSGRVLLGMIALLTVVVLGLTVRFAHPDDLSPRLLATVTSSVLVLFYPLLGILAVTSEVSQRTALVTFTAEPRRARVVVAKLVAVSWWAGVGLVVAIALGVGAHAVAVLTRGTRADLSPAWAVLGGFALTLALGVAQGVAFGLLFSGPAASVTAYFVLPSMWALVANITPGLRRLAPWLDPSSSGEVLLNGSPGAADWAHLAVSNGLWVVLPLLAGIAVLSRRELR